MAGQQVDTDVMTATVTALTAAEKRINQRFNDLKKAAKNLENDWNSEAGYAAVSRLYDLFPGNESRAQVLQNYISVISGQILPNYEKSVTANTRLADLYK